MVYQCSGRNDPVAKAESIQPLWVQQVDPASQALAEGRPQVWAHSAERCAPWMHQNRAGFVYALSGSYYWPDPSQLIVCNSIVKDILFVCLFVGALSTEQHTWIWYSNKLDRHKTGKKQYM